MVESTISLNVREAAAANLDKLAPEVGETARRTMEQLLGRLIVAATSNWSAFK